MHVSGRPEALHLAARFTPFKAFFVSGDFPGTNLT
jgi:hypothetical protein